MTLPFILVAILTLVSALAAMNLRNLVHCALSLAVAFSGFAILYLQLDAQFVGLAQVLVYLGAIAILIVFAILLTRGGISNQRILYSSSGWIGVVIAVFVAALLGYCVMGSGVVKQAPPAEPDLTVQQIGDHLMTDYVLPLEIIAVLLTATIIGAVIIASAEKHPPTGNETQPSQKPT